jgi:hypothetical protein
MIVDNVVRTLIVVLALVTNGGMLAIVYRYLQDFFRAPRSARLRPLHVMLLSSSWLLYSIAVTIGMVNSWGRPAMWWWWLYATSLALALSGLVVIFKSNAAAKRAEPSRCGCKDEPTAGRTCP